MVAYYSFVNNLHLKGHRKQKKRRSVFTHLIPTQFLIQINTSNIQIAVIYVVFFNTHIEN